MNTPEKRRGTDRPSVKRMAAGAVGIALVFVSTRILQFPIPLGYAHLGNAMILILSVYFGPGVGMAAGGLGSALADLTSFPQWTLPTLIIKTLMGLICGAVAGPPPKSSQEAKARRGRRFAACVAATAEMVLGYTLSGAVLYGSMATGLLQVPGLTAEGVVGLLIFYVFSAALNRMGATERLGLLRDGTGHR